MVSNLCVWSYRFCLRNQAQSVLALSFISQYPAIGLCSRFFWGLRADSPLKFSIPCKNDCHRAPYTGNSSAGWAHACHLDGSTQASCFYTCTQILPTLGMMKVWLSSVEFQLRHRKRRDSEGLTSWLSEQHMCHIWNPWTATQLKSGPIQVSGWGRTDWWALRLYDKDDSLRFYNPRYPHLHCGIHRWALEPTPLDS